MRRIIFNLFFLGMIHGILFSLIPVFSENGPEFLSPQSFFREKNLSGLSAEADELLFSTRSFPLEEALIKASSADPLWSCRQEIVNFKEFEHKGREVLFSRDELFESRSLVSEMIRNAIEASNNNEISGQNPVDFELRCFPEVSVIRITQHLSRDADWEKLKKNHSRFSENIFSLNRMARHGDASLMTNQGVGLDKIGDFLQNNAHPLLVRYLRGFEAPNVLTTEIYLKSSYSVPQSVKSESFDLSA